MMHCSHQHLPSFTGPRACDCGVEVHEVDSKWFALPGIYNGNLSEIKSPEVLPLFTNEKEIIRTRFHVIHDMVSNVTSLFSPSSKSRVLSTDIFNKVIAIWASYGCKVFPLDNDDKYTYEKPILISLGSNHPKLPVLESCEPSFVELDTDDENLAQKGIDMINQFSNHKTLRSEQIDAITSVLSSKGSATIAALPTGFGKTLISQACTLALRESGPTLVISPLISLIDDQEENYLKLNSLINKKKGTPLKIKFLRSSAPFDIDEINYNLLCGNIDVLCCSPETLLMKAGVGLMETIRRLGVNNKSKPFSLFVIDEAHIVSDWGVTIRPQFMMLNSVIRDLVRVNAGLRLLFMSATISTDEESFINKHLCPLHSTQTIRKAEIRKDISFSLLINNENKEPEKFAVDAARWDINSRFHKNDKAPFLIYTRSPKDALKMKDELVKFGEIATYTGETSSSQRGSLRDKFVRNKLDGIIGTSAFGMGINKPDLQCISYIGRPFSVKDLYQAFGRVSRNSNWKEIENKHRVCGNAVGIITPQSRASPFRPELGVGKMVERLWDLLSDCVQISPGLIGLKTDAIPAFWAPNISSESEELIVDEDSDIPKSDNGMPLFQRESLRRQKRRERSLHFQQWVISAFDLAGFWNIEGVWHSSYYENNGAPVQLFSLTEKQTFEEYWGQLRDPVLKFKPTGDTLILIRINSAINSISELQKYCVQALAKLKTMHSRAAKGIQEFLSAESCIRTRFGPAIGLPNEENFSCIELNISAIENDDFLATPCSICKPYYGEMFEIDEPCLWIKYHELEGIVKSKHVVNENVDYSSKWGGIPKGAIDVLVWEKIESGKYAVDLNNMQKHGLSDVFLHKQPKENIEILLFDDKGIQLESQMNSVGTIIDYFANKLVLETSLESDRLTTIVWQDCQHVIIRILPQNLSEMENARLTIKRNDVRLSDLIESRMPDGDF